MVTPVNSEDILIEPSIPTFAIDVKEQFSRVQNKLKEYISFTDFGAVGDGVTDNSTAWSNFVEYLITNNVAGKIPQGDYYISTAPGTIPSDTSTSQVDVPAIDLGSDNLVIHGAGSVSTKLISKRGIREGLSDGEVSWPLLRILNGNHFELAGVTLDGAFTSVPSPGAGTLTDSIENRVKARQACTMVETDETTNVILNDIKVVGFYGVRDNTVWEADTWAIRSRRTGGLCIHRASSVKAKDIEVLHPSFREGVYFINCAKVSIDGFTYAGDYAEQVSYGGAALSTPINIFGPETGSVTIENIYIRENGGSAANFGGAGPFTLTNFDIGSDSIAGVLGDGIDFGSEHQNQEDHPQLKKVVINSGTIKGASRYSLRAYLPEGQEIEQVVISNVVIEDCYQGIEVSGAASVIMNNIVVTRPFWYEDYDSASGRGLYCNKIDSLVLGGILLDGRGGSGTAVMRTGLFLQDIQYLTLSDCVVHEASYAHCRLYNASANTPYLNKHWSISGLHCFQTGARDGASSTTAVQFGRSGHEVENISLLNLTYNGKNILDTANALSVYSLNELPVSGLQDILLGNPLNQASATAYKELLAQIRFYNGDGSGSAADSVRASIQVVTGRSNARGATLHIKTASVDDTLADSLTVLEHGSVIFHDTAAKTDPVARTKGESWFDTDKMYLCTASGSIFGAPLVGVTATADGTNVIVVSDATGISNSMWITVDGALREVENVSGTSITLDATVTTGTGLAVAYATPTIREFQFV